MTNRKSLDAIQLRGGVLSRADAVKPGDRIMFLAPTYDFTVEEVEHCERGIRFRYGNDTASSMYMHGELVYIDRASLRARGVNAR